MAVRRVSFFIFAMVVVIAGCKPAPKSVRAKPPEPSPAVSQPRQAPAGDPQLQSEVYPSKTDLAAEPNRPAEQPKQPTPPSEVVADPNASNIGHPTDAISLKALPEEPNNIANSFNNKFESILAIYVDDKGKVDYAKLRRMRLILTPLLQELDTLDAKEYDTWPKPEKIAFWINTYNVCTLKVIADNYPIKASVYKTLFYPANSIMQIDRAWTDYKFSVMGVAYNLSEIEQRILLNQFDEQRVAFALSYASGWSPRLRNKPYYGERLDQQLDQQVREFIASGKGFRIDKDSDTVYLSIVFSATRFPTGFVEKRGSDSRFNDERPEIRALLNFISAYLDRADIDYLSGKKYSVNYIRPDWVLND
jgi:hypothetical protein